MSEQIDSALRWGSDRIGGLSESPRLDAELLLAHCLDKPRSYLYSRPELTLSEACWEQFQALIEQRLHPMPVAYLLGRREFYALEFAASPVALIPRPETELLIDRALALIPDDTPTRILDLGTGTGNIAITLKRQRPMTRVSATDIDPDCLALAQDNAARHQAEIDFIESDWYRNLVSAAEFDLIVSNPPYIAAGHPFMDQGDLPAEPELALSPGRSGLEALEQIIGGAHAHLAGGGHLVLEHGYDQQTGVAQLLNAHGFGEIACSSDLNDLPRVSQAKLIENRRASA